MFNNLSFRCTDDKLISLDPSWVGNSSVKRPIVFAKQFYYTGRWSFKSIWWRPHSKDFSHLDEFPTFCIVSLVHSRRNKKFDATKGTTTFDFRPVNGRMAVHLYLLLTSVGSFTTYNSITCPTYCMTCQTLLSHWQIVFLDIPITMISKTLSWFHILTDILQIVTVIVCIRS